MNLRIVIHILGSLSILLAAILLLPLAIALWGETAEYTPHDPTIAFAVTIVLAAIAGGISRWLSSAHGNDRIGPAEGFGVATFGWMLMALYGALPFYLSGVVPTLTDAYFETMSGFTTTGATVFGAGGGRGMIEALPRSILFWRSLTHWLGGMGIVVLSLAVLPALRAGGYQLFAAEVPGPTAERLRPRLRDTAAVLWGVYVLLSAAEAILLMAGDMPLFDALCHTFGTMATGGFSTKDASIGHYAATGHPNALYFESIINIFMFLAGCNFLLHYRALHGDLRGYRQDGEFRFYCFLLGGGIALTTLCTHLAAVAGADSLGGALRISAFQVLSITTTTGYCTADFDLWPNAARLLLCILMFCGGCAGSTGGGMKMVRIKTLLKAVGRELRLLIHPRAVIALKNSGTPIRESVLANILAFVLLYLIIFALASLAVTLTLPAAPDRSLDQDLVAAVASVAATLNNIGPGLSAVGATCNYGTLPLATKWVLTFCMLLGRLEIYTVVVVFLPYTWRR